jgi:hypothetical protein
MQGFTSVSERRIMKSLYIISMVLIVIALMAVK